MGQELHRLKRRKVILRQINNIIENPGSALVIHYSCESFYDNNNINSPRITSIAARNLESGQTESFSLNIVAEEKHLPIDDSSKYDILEKTMLDNFFTFLKAHQHFIWIHWNMRDVNYGFAALEHRYRVLGGEPSQISETNKFDISRALVDLYGIGYIEHPRLQSILQKNKITMKDFLSGNEEAKAFNDKNFTKIHQSTLRKVDNIANIFERVANGTLKTNSSWREQHGYTMQAVIEYIKEHWLFISITIISAILFFIFQVIDFFSLFN